MGGLLNLGHQLLRMGAKGKTTPVPSSPLALPSSIPCPGLEQAWGTHLYPPRAPTHPPATDHALLQMKKPRL